MSKTKDLSGLQFGWLTVVRKEENQDNNCKNHNTWICKCRCGKYVTATTSKLTSGNTKSCGCYKRFVLSQKEDLTGNKYNKLTALEESDPYIDKKGKRYTKWKCLCDCGKITYVRTSALKNGTIKYCGCISKTISKSKQIDITGKRYGMLTVIKFDHNHITPNGTVSKYWLCQCDCGNKKVIRYGSLVNGYATSCGCFRKKKLSKEKTIDLSGKKFGELTVKNLYSEKSNKSRSTLWVCKCSCGNTKIVSSAYLVSGHTTSCGCIKVSSGEYEITKILKKNSIKYEKEYSFDDLITEKGGYPRFDFAIFTKSGKLKCLIEYQGEQHYRITDDKFGVTQREITDPLKKEYCNSKNIKLYEIKYDEDIEKTLIKILKKERLFRQRRAKPEDESGKCNDYSLKEVA